MGQGGYGIDQAYLWYARDGGRFKPALNIFAFVTDDFKRMQKDNMFGYSKPLLTISNGALTVTNVPVPRRSTFSPFFARKFRAMGNLSVLKLIRKISPPETKPVIKDEDTFMVAIKVFEELKKLNDERGAGLLTVYLPTDGDYLGNRGNDFFRMELQSHLAKRGIHFLNLVDPIRSLRPEEVKKIFIPVGAIDYYQAEGHFTEYGNRKAAELIYREISRLSLVEPSGKGR
jgi:hypothetical protein